MRSRADDLPPNNIPLDALSSGVRAARPCHYYGAFFSFLLCWVAHYPNAHGYDPFMRQTLGLATASDFSNNKYMSRISYNSLLHFPKEEPWRNGSALVFGQRTLYTKGCGFGKLCPTLHDRVRGQLLTVNVQIPMGFASLLFFYLFVFLLLRIFGSVVHWKR